MRKACYKEAAKSKRYSVTIKSIEHKGHEAFQKSEIKHRKGYETVGIVKKKLYEFYELVEKSGILAFQKVVKTFKNWETEILNSFVFDYSNVFLEGINNTTKVMKRTAFGYRKFEHMRAKVLLNYQLKDQLNHLVM